MSRRLLRLTLLVRCVVSLAFAAYLVAAHPESNPALARGFIPFGLADGALAFMLAILVLSAGWHAGIAMVATIDGVIRIAAALALHFGPGAPDFSLTVVLFVGVLAAVSFSLGVLELGEAKRLRRQIGRNPVSVALAAAGLATIALAVVAFVATPLPDTSRRLLIAGAILESATLLLAAIGAGRE
ncbi:MAG: hypothetical protein JWM41_759 [Gemmatimonadetes bacterium]|nr:hypothetical protein [Gemmatimonadota bacterium]